MYMYARHSEPSASAHTHTALSLLGFAVVEPDSGCQLLYAPPQPPRQSATSCALNNRKCIGEWGAVSSPTNNHILDDRTRYDGCAMQSCRCITQTDSIPAPRLRVVAIECRHRYRVWCPPDADPQTSHRCTYIYIYITMYNK